MKTRPSYALIASMFAHLFPPSRSVITESTNSSPPRLRSRYYASSGSGQPPDVWGQSRACHQMRRKNVRSGHVAHYRPRKAAR